MAGVSETRTWDAVLSTTLANYRKKLIDNIFDVYPHLSYLNGKLGKLVRSNSVKNVRRTVSGGDRIGEHLLYGQNSTAKAYSNYETINPVPQDGITMAFFNWKQYAVSITISGKERRNNQGKEKMLNLLQAKVQQAEQSLRDLLSVDSFGTGSDSGKALNGLGNLVSTTATAGGISPTAQTWWKSSVKTAAGSFATNGLSLMRTYFNNIARGNDKADVIITDQSTHEYYEKVIQGTQRIIVANDKVADAGFPNIAFRGVPVMFDRDCTSGYMYFLNGNYYSFVVHKDADMAQSPMIQRDDQDAFSARIILQANQTTNNRRNLAVIQGFTA